MFSVLMLSVWQELAGLLEKNQGIRKLQLNSINVGDEVRFLFNSFTSSRISGLVAPEVRLNLQMYNELKILLSCIGLALEALFSFDPISTIIATDFEFDLIGCREPKLLLKC
jgi:hypothetical protein